MSAFSRSLCSRCGPESLHKLGACVGCSGAVKAPATQTQRTNQTGFNNELVSQAKARVEKRRKAKAGGRYGVLGRPRSYDLTDRERQVATLIAAGFTQALVAKRLNVTRAAVCSALKRAMERIGAEHGYELRRYVRDGVVA